MSPDHLGLVISDYSAKKSMNRVYELAGRSTATSLFTSSPDEVRQLVFLNEFAAVKLIDKVLIRNDSVSIGVIYERRS